MLIALATWGFTVFATSEGSDPFAKFYQAAEAAGAKRNAGGNKPARMPIAAPFPPENPVPPQEDCESRLIPPIESAKFRMRYFKNRRSGETAEMIELTAPHLMAFSYFSDGPTLKVYVRPQATRLPRSNPLIEAGADGYSPQPVTFSFAENESPQRRVMRVLKTVAPSALHLFPRKFKAEFYPSPDSLLVVSRSLFIQLKTPLDRKIFDWEAWDVGGLIQHLEEVAEGDGILELNLHHLLQQTKIGAPAWTGERINLNNLDSSHLPQTVFDLHIKPRRNWRLRRWFVPSSSEHWNFFSEDRHEYAVSRLGSANQISLLPVKKINSQVWVGLKTIDTPVPQQMNGEGSVIWALPTWRVYTGETSLKIAVQDASLRFEREFDIPIISTQTLGASFRTDPAVSADLIYPYIAEVNSDSRFGQGLAWFPLDFVMGKLSEIKDARLLLTLYRLEQATRPRH